MSARIVYGVGPSDARLIAIGEALGKSEDEQGKPFVGAAGEILDDLLLGAKIDRRKIYITNVVKVRPPENKLDRLSEIPNPETGKGYTIEDFLPLLWREIEAIKPNVILGLGSTALQYVAGKHGKSNGITEWRGSIISALDSRPTKCVFTYHPAALFDRDRDQHSGEGAFSWRFKAIMQFDFIRAREQSLFPEIRKPDRYIKICRHSVDLWRFLKENDVQI